MKILAIMGSPHRGNSLQATQRIEQKLAQFGDVEFDYVHLRDVELKPCRGCFVCFIKGEERCPVKDDKEMIAQKIEEADGVIFVSPVYSMHVSYLFKQFVDRFACTFHRPRYWGKYALTVAVAGNVGLKETNKYLKDMATAWGFEVVDELGYRMAPRNTPMRAYRCAKGPHRRGRGQVLFGHQGEAAPETDVSRSLYLPHHAGFLRQIGNHVPHRLPVLEGKGLARAGGSVFS